MQQHLTNIYVSWFIYIEIIVQVKEEKLDQCSVTNVHKIPTNLQMWKSEEVQSIEVSGLNENNVPLSDRVAE